MSFGAWIALTVGAEDPRVSTLIGIAPPLVALRLRRGRAEHEAEVLHPGRVRRDLPAEGDARVLRARRRAEGAGRHRRRGSSVRRQGQRSRPTRSRICSRIGRGERMWLLDVVWSEGISKSNRLAKWGSHMKEAVIVSAVRTAVGKAPNGTLRGTRPDELARVAIAEALKRAPGIDPAEIDDVILGCAMPEAEQGMNVARIASLRAGIPVERVGGDDQPLLLVRAAGDRLCRRAHHVRVRVDDRRRRHRVDEPGADGRPQDRAEPDADRQLSGRLPQHRPGRREPRARVGHLARGAGRVRAAQPPARARGDRQRPLRRRDRAGHRDADRRGQQRRRAENAPGHVRHRRRAAPRHVGRSAGEAAAGVPRRPAR